VILAAIALVVVIAGVAIFVMRDDDSEHQVSTDTTATSEPGTTATERTTAPSTTVTAPARTAAEDLDAFFTAAERLDQHLSTAAAGINRSIAAGDPNVDQATADTLGAATGAITELEDSIPTGLEPEFLRAVLLVESDLVSRTFAMRFATRPDALTGVGWSETEACLQNGAEAAARYPADLAALGSLANASPPVAVAAPDSLAAEVLAVRLGWIGLLNSGCDGCGGYVATDLAQVTVYDTPTYSTQAGRLVDGVVDEVGFWASFDADAGWHIQFNAC
jgi:hypothetical protein